MPTVKFLHIQEVNSWFCSPIEYQEQLPNLSPIIHLQLEKLFATYSSPPQTASQSILMDSMCIWSMVKQRFMYPNDSNALNNRLFLRICHHIS